MTTEIAAATPIQRALACFENSPTKLAEAISATLAPGAPPVLRQHVEHWRKTGRVPTEHVRAIHGITAVPSWDFCPGDWWRIWPDLIGAVGAPDVPRASIPEPAPEAS